MERVGRLFGEEVAARHPGRREVVGPATPHLGGVGELVLVLTRDEETSRLV